MYMRHSVLRTTRDPLAAAPLAKAADKRPQVVRKAPHPSAGPWARLGRSIRGLRDPVRPTNAPYRLGRRRREPRLGPLVGLTCTQPNFSPADPRRPPSRTGGCLWSPSPPFKPTPAPPPPFHKTTPR